jgi:hypothetical protein
LVDFKTTNASASKEAAAPEGIYYEYFVQLGIYALAHQEMFQKEYKAGAITKIEYDTEKAFDDFLLVSCRKDGGFSTIYASDIGLSVQDCIDWAKAVISCYDLAKKTKEGLLAHAKPKVNDSKEEF